jgi:lipopolysaccharide/colanic/teichoic acid biosynthesis glycosyltransferase
MNTPSAVKRLINPKTRSQRQWHVLLAALVLLDMLCVAGSLTLAYYVRIDGMLLQYYAQPHSEVYQTLVFAALPIFLLCFALVGLYCSDNLLGGIVEYKQVVKGCTVGVVLLVMYTVFARLQDFDVSRGWIIISWLFSVLLVSLMRFLVRRAAYKLRAQGYLSSRVLIVGANDQGVAIAEQWRSTPASGMHVVGFLDDFKPIGTQIIPRAKVLGRPSAIDALGRQYDVDEVIVISSAVAWESFGELVTNTDANKRYTVRLSPGFYELLTTGVAVTNKTFVPLLTINENRIVGVDAVLKGALDFGLGGLFALITAPFALALAVLLKLRRPHAPVFVRSSVIGRKGQAFGMLRFNIAPARGERHQNLHRWLRVTGLNKWPELLNVLNGEMSLVGPHPRKDHNEVTDMHTMHNLQAVKPGIVGPWLRRDHLLSPSLLHDELNYVRNWQIWSDLAILFQASAMLLNRLSYKHVSHASRTSTSTSTSIHALRNRVGEITTMPKSAARVESNLQEDLQV